MSRIFAPALLAWIALVGAGCGVDAIVTAPLSAVRPASNLDEDTWRTELLEPVSVVDEADPVRVMSFNLRVRNSFDFFNGWAFRRDLVVETITNFDPDILGTQEGLLSQTEELETRLPDYAFVGVGRDDGKRRGETAGIFYRSDRFEPVDSGHFWLSDTPAVPGSRSWGNWFNRMVTWVQLRDLTHAERPALFVFNTHFDSISSNARYHSAHLLQQQIEAIAGSEPVVVMGDFNAGEGSPPYQVLVNADQGRHLRDTYRMVHPEPASREGTIHSFRGGTGGDRIDWILTCERLTPVAAEIDRTRSGRRYPSDHFPVSAVMLWTHPNQPHTAATDDASHPEEAS